jgi:hypothetical protein
MLIESMKRNRRTPLIIGSLLVAALTFTIVVFVLNSQEGVGSPFPGDQTNSSTESQSGRTVSVNPSSTPASIHQPTIPELDVRSRLIKQVRWFFTTYTVDGFTAWKVLDTAAEIPAGENAIRHPLDYQDIVQPPQVIQEGTGYRVILFTWTGDMGMLARWELTVEGNTLTHLYGQVVDVLVGEVTRVRTEGPFLPTPNKVITDERKAVLLP